jgi:hypothetical protein
MDIIITENNSDKDGYWAEGTVNGRQFNISTFDSYDIKLIALQNPHLIEDEVKALYTQVNTPKFLNGETYSTATKRYAIKVERKVTTIATIYVEARSEEDAQDKFDAADLDSEDDELCTEVQQADWELDDEEFDVLEISEVD